MLMYFETACVLSESSAVRSCECASVSVCGFFSTYLWVFTAGMNFLLLE